MNCNYQQVLGQLKIDSRIVLATVIRSSGSTPQKPGSSALFNEKGLLAGTVGGGSIEGEVQLESISALATGVSDHYYYNLDKDQGGLEAICGGDVVVLIDAKVFRNLMYMLKY